MKPRLFAFGALLLAWVPLVAATDDAELRLAIILTRHGVRTPLQTNEVLDRLSEKPWPRWTLPPGTLTDHGHRGMVLMGKYYHDRYLAAGLLSGKPADDAAALYVNADNDTRTIISAQAIAAELALGTDVPVAALPAGTIDPLYRPAAVPVGRPDRTLATAAVKGRVGDNPALLDQVWGPTLRDLREVVYGPGGQPPAGKDPALNAPTDVGAGPTDETVRLNGALSAARRVIEGMILEYADGRPMAEVGWGRVTPDLLAEFVALHAYTFQLTAGAFAPARMQGSNLAAHLLDTIDQAVSGQPRPGAFGRPGTRIVVLGAHDTNIVNLAGMLGLHWLVPGAGDTSPLPAGALVFEVYRHRATGDFEVRVQYVAPTLAQSRDLTPLSLDRPPAVAPVFVPECSTTESGYPAPLGRFEAVVRRVIDPAFVTPLTD